MRGAAQPLRETWRVSPGAAWILWVLRVLVQTPPSSYLIPMSPHQAPIFLEKFRQVSILCKQASLQVLQLFLQCIVMLVAPKDRGNSGFCSFCATRGEEAVPTPGAHGLLSELLVSCGALQDEADCR